MTKLLEPSKACQTCGHPRAWHSNICWGNPLYKGICSSRCKQFKGLKKDKDRPLDVIIQEEIDRLTK